MLLVDESDQTTVICLCQHPAQIKIQKWLKLCFCSLTIGLKVTCSISPDRHLLQARMLTFMIWCKLNFCFCFSLLIVFSACSAKMMYSVSRCGLFLLVLLCQAPGRCVMAATFEWKAPVETWLAECYSLKPYIYTHWERNVKDQRWGLLHHQRSSIWSVIKSVWIPVISPCF